MIYQPANFSHIYWIGGSPCSGKSTIAEQLSAQYNTTYYKCDDHYNEHTRRATPTDQPVMSQFARMSWEATWMRDVDVMLADEFCAYDEQFPMILDDLLQLPKDKPIIAEGAALMPHLVLPLLSDASRAIWIVPTPDFQRQYYSQRDWIQGILNETSDPTKAFDNWMQRDARFAERVLADAKTHNYKTIVVDGARSIDSNRQIVEQHFFAK